ncbi:hypothetical protein [Phenylobacterium sp.]|uniref:hypothetical protein n=1 Tax=Phenylobacterium sp. TaxID=1871053 RepID=UPI0025FC99FF|nr:hypothetical protein [Phenylobacterium sp.]
MNASAQRGPPPKAGRKVDAGTQAEIDALMALPPKRRPSITVIGDDAVTSITLPDRPA